MTQTKLQSLVKLITVLATTLLFVLLCIVIYQYVRLGTLSKKDTELDRKIAELSVTEAELREGIKKRSSDSYIEQEARENLGMIEENGETIYVIS